MTCASGCSSAGNSQSLEDGKHDCAVQTKVNGPDSCSSSHVQHPTKFLRLINNSRQFTAKCQSEHMVLEICLVVRLYRTNLKSLCSSYQGGHSRSG